MDGGGRIPAHLEVSGLIRAAEAAGGFGMVIEKGERDAGAILVICSEKGTKARLFERMPQLDGSRKFVETRKQDAENPFEFQEYLQRRKRQDSDLWIVELDAADAQSFLPGGD